MLLSALRETLRLYSDNFTTRVRGLTSKNLATVAAGLVVLRVVRAKLGTVTRDRQIER